jgi:AraC-like DNA-binding protein
VAVGLTVLFAGWFLAPRQDVFAVENPVIAPGTTPSDARTGNSEDTRFSHRLLTLMQVEKAYREEALTIALLARKLELPEYRLRRVINQQLGYRNFNAFLNDLRIEEACQILADPAHERLPILNLALDLGYGSPGPFNRAFRAKTGQTPTEYRRARLGTSSPAAELVRRILENVADFENRPPITLSDATLGGCLPYSSPTWQNAHPRQQHEAHPPSVPSSPS